MLTTALVFLAAGCSRKGAAGPLIDAACHGNVARCEQLVKRGFAVDATDSEGNTALDWAVYYCKVDVVLKLVELGANVNHANDWHFEPLEYTASPLRGRSLHGTQEERNEIARILIQHGANVNHAIGNGRAIGSGQPVLHFAAADRNAGLVRILLEAGANRNAKSNQGYTPLDVAKSPNYAPNDEVIRAFEAR
jgi:ankyrin repeat protein